MAKETPKTQKQENTTGTIEGIENRNIFSEFVLPSGKKCVIKRFKGKHVQQAQRLMKDDGSDMAECLASILVEVDGKQLFKDEFEEMDGIDYFKIMNPINQLFL
jgi:hypothetical protein